MEQEPAPIQSTIRGADLPGAVKVMPLGLDAAIKKRVSGEFKSERSNSSLSFSNNTRQEVNSTSASSAKMESSFSSSMVANKQQQQQQQFSGMNQQQLGFEANSEFSQMSAQRGMTMMSSSSASQSSSSSSTKKTTSSSFSSSSSSSLKQQQQAVKSISFGTVQEDFEDAVHGQEIRQDNLKNQIQSAIVDLESEMTQDFKENVSPAGMKSPTPVKPFSPAPPPTLSSPAPPPNFSSPVPQVAVFSPPPQGKQDMFSPPPQGKQDMFSPPPLEPVEQRARSPSPVLAHQVFQEIQPNVQMMQNGFVEFSRNMEMKQSSSSTTTSSSTTNNFQSSSIKMNGNSHYEESSGLQESGSLGSLLSGGGSSSSSLLQKIMTPAPQEYDSSSLKRRDPRKMFTDSSFYSAKHHPTVADQVEMAHKISSALFREDNRNSKGQQMYINRLKKSGEEIDEVDAAPKHDSVPNLKLVMNPEGKVHEWADIDPQDLPNPGLLAGHALPNLPSPDISNPVVEDLNANTGKGETFLHRPNAFVSAYRRVFDQNRGVFGGEAGGPGSAVSPANNSPQLPRKPTGGTTAVSSGCASATQNTIISANSGKPTGTCCGGATATKNSAATRAMLFSKEVPLATASVPVGSAKGRPIAATGGGILAANSSPKPFRTEVAPNRMESRSIIATGAGLGTNDKTMEKSLASVNISQAVPGGNRKENTSISSGLVQDASRKTVSQARTTETPIKVETDSGTPVRPKRVTLAAKVNSNSDNKPNPAAEKIAGVSQINKVTGILQPADILKTPSLTPPSSTSKQPGIDQPKLADAANKAAGGGGFPHLPGNSMVAKAKALFEQYEGRGKENHFPGTQPEFAPLKRSRTFSSFPTNSTTEGEGGSVGRGLGENGRVTREGKESCSLLFPLTPSPPQRSSSRKVLADYKFKSMNSNINSCGLEEQDEVEGQEGGRPIQPSRPRRSTALQLAADPRGGGSVGAINGLGETDCESPGLQRRPLRNFFE